MESIFQKLLSYFPLKSSGQESESVSQRPAFSSRTSPQVLHCQPKPWDEKQTDCCLAGGLFIACVLCAQPWARPSWEQWKAACAWRSPEGSGQVRRTQGRSTHRVCVGRWVLTCPHVLSQVQIRKGSCRLCTQIDNSQETFRGFLDLVLMLKSFSIFPIPNLHVSRYILM